MKYSPGKFALIVMAGDFVLSSPLILAMDFNIFGDVDMNDEFISTFEPVWYFIHSPTVKLIDGMLFADGWIMHDPLPVWFSFAHYGASFLQTFVVAFAVYWAFVAYRKFLRKQQT